MFRSFIKKYNFCYLLNSLRAFRKVRAIEGEREIFSFLNFIAKQILSKSFFSVSLVLGRNLEKYLPRLIVQKILHENLDKGLATSIMMWRSGEKFPVILPLPSFFRKLLKKHDINLHSFSGLCFFKNVLASLKGALRNLLHLMRYNNQSKIFLLDYKIFIGFPKNALEHKDSLKNFMSFAKKRFDKSTIVTFGAFDVKSAHDCHLKEFPFPSIDQKYKKRFFFGSLWTFLKVFLFFLVGRFEAAYLYSDWLLYYYVSFLNEEKLPSEVIFSNSHYIYRPLWTQRMLEKGKDVSLLFYSTNTYNLNFNDGSNYGLVAGYSTMDWSCYYTFHKNHAHFIKENIDNDAKVFIDSLIPLEDFDDTLVLPKGFKIALFDVQPFRDGFLARIGRPTSIYTYKISKKYFDDLLSWCEKKDVFLIVKPKRKVGRFLCPSYFKMLELFKSSKKVCLIDSLYAPERVCDSVDVVVCQPFTSVALFAQKKNVPVVYYDPEKFFKDGQAAQQNIPMLQGKKALFEWLDEMKNDYDCKVNTLSSRN